MSEDTGSCETPEREMLADFVFRIRRGDRLYIDDASGFGTMIPGSKLTGRIADIIEASIGIRKTEASDGLISIKTIVQ